MRGYQLWQESGSAHGHDREHWRQAEQEIQAVEQPALPVGARRVESYRQTGDGIPSTPIAMLYAMAQGWIEFGGVFAGTTMWPVWRPGAE